MIRGFIFMAVIYNFKYLKTHPRKRNLALMTLNQAKVDHRQQVVVLGWDSLGRRVAGGAGPGFPGKLLGILDPSSPLNIPTLNARKPRLKGQEKRVQLAFELSSV